MKATVSIVVNVELDVDSREELEAAVTTLGGRVHFILADGIEEASIEHWDYVTATTFNMGAGVSLVNKES